MLTLCCYSEPLGDFCFFVNDVTHQVGIISCYLHTIWYDYVSRQEKTVMKLVVDGDTQKVLGASMCGPDAPEIMQVCSVINLENVIIFATLYPRISI